jgi:uncharacterized membrane protein
MLIPFPIALWIFSFVCDVVYALGWGGPIWLEMGFYTMGGGILGALAAAIFGLGDYLSLTEPATIRVGKAHMLLNLAIVALYVVNFLLRLWTAGGAGTIVLSAVALVLLGVSGWLGGELVYVHGVAVDGSSARRITVKGKTTAA